VAYHPQANGLVERRNVEVNKGSVIEVELVETSRGSLITVIMTAEDMNLVIISQNQVKKADIDIGSCILVVFLKFEMLGTLLSKF
jgi:hypothetical protein